MATISLFNVLCAAGAILFVLWLTGSVFKKLNGRKAQHPARSTPQGAAPADLAPKDEWVNLAELGLDPFGPAAHPLQASLQINYRDRQGLLTSRQITTKKFALNDQEGIIAAHCHMRDATRTFLLSGIQQAVDTQTGEVIKNLRRWLKDEYQKSPDGLADQARAMHSEALLVFAYAARADGTFRKAKQAAISRFLESQGVAAEIAAVVAADLKSAEPPTIRELTQIMKALSPRPDAYQTAVRECCRTILSDGKRSLEEQAALVRIEKGIPAAVPAQN